MWTLNNYINIYIAEPECADTTGSLVDGNPPIPDGHMTATSAHNGYWVAPFARMSSGNTWCAASVDRNAAVLNFFIQVRTFLSD